jgi:hypothetical protein
MSVPRPSPQSPLKPTLRPDVAVRFGKPLVFLLCLTPLALLVWRALSDGLGANPVEAIVHFTGSWALRLLLVTLAVTPLRRLSGQPWLIRFRRMLGLFAFFYALLHFAAYLVLDRALVWEDIITDLTKRPYIVVGFVGPAAAGPPGGHLHPGLDQAPRPPLGDPASHRLCHRHPGPCCISSGW